MSSDLLTIYRRELKSWEDELNLFPDDASVWKVVPGLPNSAGTLTLHICGNLRHFLGSILGGTGFVRDRESEFSRKDEPRSTLVADLHTTLREVTAVFEGLDDSALDTVYPARVGKDLQVNTRMFLIHLAVHLSYHLGQVDYARRAVTGDSASAGTLPLQPIAM